MSRKFIVSLAFCGAVLLAVGAGYAIAAGTGYSVTRLTGSDEHTHTDIAPTTHPLRSPLRSHLIVCVDDGSSKGADPADLEHARAALDAAAGTVDGLPEEYGEPEVISGCPAPSASLGTAITQYDIEGRNVSSPSEAALFLYALPEALYASTFGAESHIIANEEFICEKDACVPVTKSIYMASPLEEPRLASALLEALGLVETAPPPDIIIDWEACERGERPHPDFECSDYDEETGDLRK
jgi:hypothetical protein